MRKKIFLYYIVLVIIGVSITGFFTSQLAHKYYMYEVEEKLKDAASLIEFHIKDDINKNIAVDYDTYAKRYSAILSHKADSSYSSQQADTRITFIDFTGKVLGESEVDYKSMENHLNRKEVQDAIKGNIGKDTHFSRTLGVTFFYIAMPVYENKVIVRISVPLLQINKINSLIWYYTLIGITAGLLLTILLALKFSRSVTSPINELIMAAREISKGNYSNRVYINSKDELGELAGTFNEMADKLDRTLADIIDKNVKVDSIIDSMTSGMVAVDNNFRIMLINSIACDMFNIRSGPAVIGMNILELIRNNQINNLLKHTIETSEPLTTEITMGSPHDIILRVYTAPIKSKDNNSPNSGGIISIHDITNIKKLEQIRTEFVSNVTHELKTPLTSIRGFVETLRSGAIDDRNVSDKFLEIIDIEAERLYMLINDILQLSEIENRRKDINIGVYKFKSIIDEIIPILEGVAEKKNVSLDFNIEDSLTLKVNKDKIKQMMINLVDNAIKYNKENGTVFISAYRDSGKTVIKVRDTGIGIARENLSRVFERFYRVDKGRSRSMGGTGLGLSIVKHIVNLYSGDIKVTSEPGVGTEFTVQLPV